MILIAFVLACSPATKLVNTWVDPSLTGETLKPFKNVLVIARIKDETSNRVTEDKIVAKLKCTCFSFLCIPAAERYQCSISGSEVEERWF